MSKSQSKITSPSRSQGAMTPRRSRTRRTLSVASPARSDASGKLSSVVEKFIKNDKFTMSPMRRRSVLPDDTEIEAPRRASWWKRLEGSSRDVLEALDTNKMPQDLLVAEYEFEVEKDKDKTVSECSDNESVVSIVVSQRPLFNQKKETQGKFGEIMGSRKSLGRTNIEDISIDDAPKNLFNKRPRNRLVFPAALLNSTNKTINKSVEPEPSKPNRPTLFGQAGTKRKNMFTDFVLSESEEDSEVQPKVFGFNKYDNKRMSLGTRNRMPSLTPSMTTEIDIDDWNLLPSSTMIGTAEVSRITNDDMDQISNENQDDTLTEDNTPLKADADNKSTHKSLRVSDENDRTLTNEDSENAMQKDKSEEEIEVSAEEQQIQDSSKEASITNQDEEMEDVSEKDKSEEEIETKAEEESQDSKEASDTNNDVDIDDMSEKEKSKEISHENQDEEMEEMVWNDDDEKQSEHYKAHENAEAELRDEAEQNCNEENNVKERASVIENDTNKSQKIIESPVDDNQMEEDNDVDETPNDSTQDTTGRNRKKEETHFKSPEAVLQNMTKDNDSFRPIGRSTSFHKSKSVIENINIRPSLAPVHESTLGSDGSRHSSTEGSEWDSHRTTRKTIRQTFGKGFTPRKSLRALIMEQSAKRQTEIYDKNASKLNKTKNKTALEDGAYKNSSQTNKTNNKSVLENTADNNALKISKTVNNTASENVNERNASKMNKTKNKTVFEDIENQLPRDRRMSIHNTSSDQLPYLKSPALGTSAHHVSDPIISEPQVSYHKSVHDLNEPEMVEQPMSPREISIEASNDSAPEISIHASYGQGMSREGSDRHEEQTLGYKTSHEIKEISRRDTLVRVEPSRVTDQEVLDYEASDYEKSVQETSAHEKEDNVESNQANSEHEDSIQEQEEENSEPEESTNEVEIDESGHESEVEESRQENEPESEEVIEEEDEPESDQDESQHDIEVESDPEIEAESDQEESQQDKEVEPEQEDSQHEIEAESEQDESNQEIEVESDQEESQQEIEADESDQEESQQEIEADESDQEESQQEIEVESDQDVSQQEIESESGQEETGHEVDHDMSHENAQSDEENVHDVPETPGSQHSDHDENIAEDSDHLISGLNSQYHMSNSNRTERVVFDNEISEQEIDYGLSERVSRHITDTEISEQVSEREATPEVTRSRVSEHSKVHDVSIGTKKSILLMHMQRIAQQNMEARQKIREQVQKSLKVSRNFNKMSPIQSKFPIRRINKTEPKKPKAKPKPRNIPIEALPKDFVEDLMYKPPKRFQPASAPWITKRLYKFLETKLEPKYDYRARVRAEELVQTIHSFTKLARRHDLAPQNAVDELKREMARLHVVNTHFEFYEFFHEYMPREIRIKVNPDVVNKIQLPRNGVFSNILPARVPVE